ncbi:hypothetical protein CPHO_11060 [Corynebacterium phocae]|uniref:Uncharacterized protein n=1 Tax=Corynebacterium phocae TaxID=161895 RepID=A0A1L7D5M1_9CORY|nr:hypothetical protein [Corynebacterium phocae]APT93341.1 hypothetical protein CPHO_11060 [Corynebacterium phocae]KAA8721674.1 hypothetical protein F4V58_10535 [Corynebacterium phocae]
MKYLQITSCSQSVRLCNQLARLERAALSPPPGPGNPSGGGYTAAALRAATETWERELQSADRRAVELAESFRGFLDQAAHADAHLRRKLEAG